MFAPSLWSECMAAKLQNNLTTLGLMSSLGLHTQPTSLGNFNVSTMDSSKMHTSTESFNRHVNSGHISDVNMSVCRLLFLLFLYQTVIDTSNARLSTRAAILWGGWVGDISSMKMGEESSILQHIKPRNLWAKNIYMNISSHHHAFTALFWIFSLLF